jgi:hypothetical protein
MTEALHALMEGLIDYAGMFPPAALDLRAAMHNYQSYLEGEHAWMLGRFVAPAARLNELPAWEVSAIGIPSRPVDSCEIKVDRASEAAKVLDGIPKGTIPYFEIPASDDPAPVAVLGSRAKIRTGGVTPEAFPSCAELAQFLGRCAAAKVPFKATAGLHHPVRSRRQLSDEASATMHGFVNVFLAAALVWHGGNEADAAATLEETSPGAFRFFDHCACWHGHTLMTSQIAGARREFAISFGSCSFEEPIQDLKDLGWL